MARAELFLLIILSLSSALIDPPVMEVHEHNVGMAPQEIVHDNVLGIAESTPTVENPVRFFYVRILTLTPSVNGSVTSKEGMHPQLVWLVAEEHNRTVREEYDSGGCERYERERSYGDLRVEGITAHYVVDGLIENAGSGYVYNTANSTVELGFNGSITGSNPSEAPFKKTLGCALLDFLTKTLLGGMINLDCYEEALVRASPYPAGNVTFWNRTLVIAKPHLNVTLEGAFSIPYEERGSERFETEGGCEGRSWHGNGTIMLHGSDFASYEVQNDYMALLPFGPALLNLSGETSEQPLYRFSLFSNSELYKYYSRMDGKTASAYYIHSFDVVNDSFGTQFIIANVTEHDGLLAEDPEAANNYTGVRRLLVNLHGDYLRNAVQFSNLSYNYSRVYGFEEAFYNLTPGWHHADFLFYTWWGDYSAGSDIHSRLLTELTLSAYPGAGQVAVSCLLRERNSGFPVPGQAVAISCGGDEQVAYTDGDGVCNTVFQSNKTTAFLSGDFAGSDSHLPASAVLMSGGGGAFDLGQGLVFSNDMCLLVFAMLLGISFIGMASSFGFRGGGMTAGDAFGKFFPFAKKPGPGKKAVRVKKGRELAVSVAVAAAGGGNAGSKLAGDAAKKKVEGAAKKPADDAKKKAREKAKREYEEKRKRAMMDGMEKKQLEKNKAARGLVQSEHIKNKERIAKTLSESDLKKMLENKQKSRKQAGVISVLRLHPGIQRLHEMAHSACEKIGRPDMARGFLTVQQELDGVQCSLKISTPRLRVVDDVFFDEYLRRGGENSPQKIGALTEIEINADLYKGKGTVKSIIDIRESRLDSMHHILEDVEHEKNHPFNKLTGEQHKGRVEGFNECIMFEHSQTDPKVPDEVKKEIAITEPYRPYAAQNHLVENIIGKDHNVVGHLVAGEEHLREQFDKVAGKGEYDRIYASDYDKRTGEWVDRMSDADKIKALETIYNNLDRPLDEKIKVAKNVNKITSEGKYDL